MFSGTLEEIVKTYGRPNRMNIHANWQIDARML